MEPETRPDRRLAAVMATDVVGYSILMQSDEPAALFALTAIRDATQKQIKGHRGGIADTAGDSYAHQAGTIASGVMPWRQKCLIRRWIWASVWVVLATSFAAGPVHAQQPPTIERLNTDEPPRGAFAASGSGQLVHARNSRSRF